MSIRHAVALAALAGLFGCSTPYTIRQQSRPNPFATRGASFAIMPLDYTPIDVSGTPETSWDARERADFERAKIAANAAFQEEFAKVLRQDGIAAAPAGSPLAANAAFVIQPHVITVTPSDFSGMGGTTTDLRVGATISTRDGQVLDVVEVEHSTAGDLLAGNVHRRMTIDGSHVGERLALYVHERVLPGTELR